MLVIRRFFKVDGPMTNLLENVRKRRTKILVMLAANQMNEQHLENTFVPQDQDLGHWSSYLKKGLMNHRDTRHELTFILFILFPCMFPIKYILIIFFLPKFMANITKLSEWKSCLQDPYSHFDKITAGNLRNSWVFIRHLLLVDMHFWNFCLWG